MKNNRKKNIILAKLETYKKLKKALFSPFSFFVFPFLLLFFSHLTFAAPSQGVAIDNFRDRQYNLLFESNLGKIDSEYGDIFSISKKLDVYDSITAKVQDSRIKTEGKISSTMSRITSLEQSKKIIEEDIQKTMEGIKKINLEVVQKRKDISLNSEKITILKNKISINQSILLDYLGYIYKKSNTAYDGTQIDNLKTILLNNDEVGTVIDDLYYSSLIQEEGKKLVDSYMEMIKELYVKKLELEKEKKELSLLRKSLIIAQKNLSDKREFKERLIKSFKNRENDYKKFLNQKIQIEEKLRQETAKEQIKLEKLKEKILSKHACEFVDLSKNTLEGRAMEVKSPKCYKINKMIYSESQLNKDRIRNQSDEKKNIFEWPISPFRGLTAYFDDANYKKEIGTDHKAIDIRAYQGTPIKAPLDGYVLYVEKPSTPDYSYIAIKHYDGFISVYGHLSEVNVERYDYVEKGDIIGKTGGEYGTKGAGYITSGPHLHFEVYKDKKLVDPLKYLDLSYLAYSSLPKSAYKTKYLFDFQKRKGYAYKLKDANTRTFYLEGKTEIERQKYFIRKYAVGSFNNWQMWVDEALLGNIDPSLIMCIGLAESSLGKHLTTAYNVGNVGNNDRGDRKGYRNARQGVFMIVHTLNNRYFSSINRLDKLSGAGRIHSGLPSCKIVGEYCYATDTRHWHNNVQGCVSHLKGELIDDDYNFRLD